MNSKPVQPAHEQDDSPISDAVDVTDVACMPAAALTATGPEHHSRREGVTRRRNLNGSAPSADPIEPPDAEPDLSFFQDVADVPPFPCDALQPHTRDFVTRLSEERRVSPDFICAALWPTVAASMGTALRLLIASGVSEPAIIWALLVGRPACGKSTAINAFNIPLQEIEKSLRSDDSAADFILDVYEKELARHTVQRVRTAVQRGQEMPSGLFVPSRSPPLRLLVSDTTRAGLIQFLQAQPRGGLISNDEIITVLRGALTTRSDGRALLLQAFDGGSCTVDRANGGSVFLPAVHLSVLGGVQPDRVAAVLGPDDDGLISRFLITWPEVPLDARLPTGHEADMRLPALIRDLLSLPTPTNPGSPRFVVLGAHARRRVEAASRRWIAAAEGRSDAMFGVFARARKHALRLSLVMEITECVLAGEALPQTVHDASMVSAVAIVDYHLAMAERLLTATRPSRDLLDLRRVADAISRRGETQINARILRRSAGFPVRDHKALDTVLEELVDRGCLKHAPRPPSAKGRPAGDYLVHPALLTRSRAARR